MNEGTQPRSARLSRPLLASVAGVVVVSGLAVSSFDLSVGSDGFEALTDDPEQTSETSTSLGSEREPDLAAGLSGRSSGRAEEQVEPLRVEVGSDSTATEATGDSTTTTGEASTSSEAPDPASTDNPGSSVATDGSGNGDGDTGAPGGDTTAGGDGEAAPTTTSGSETTPDRPTTTAPSGNKRSLAFYGMEWTADPRPGDLEKVASLGVNAIMVDFDGTNPDRWIRQLDEAQRLGFKVVANYWPGRPAWVRAGDGWEIPGASAEFVRTVADHPALLAVYLLHEPYWNNGNGISTEQQRNLYNRVKAIADVPLYSAFAWSAFEQGKWDTGICDYCDTWFYPSEFSNPYNEAELNRKLENILNHFNRRAGGTNIKLVWILQAFESSQYNKQMPTYDEMVRMASTAINYRASSGQQIDALFWYTWRHGSEYQQVLGDHPNLQPAVAEVKNRFVR